MEFNTRLSIIRTGFKTQAISRTDAHLELEKMARDVKNVKYLDAFIM
jgi:hypothetical protein